MKRLYLIRHAKSSWGNPDLDDHERPLNARGKRDAPEMGKRLKKSGVKPDLIVSSSAKRALKTAKIIAQELGYPKAGIVVEEAIYESESMASLLAVIRQFDDAHNHVFMLGHNPAFTMLSRLLSDHQVENIPTGGVFCMDFDIASWQQVAAGKGKLVFFDYPKKTAE